MPKYFKPKIALFGSGRIGATVGLLSSLRNLSTRLVYIDIADSMVKGTALDTAQGLAAISTCSDFADTGLQGDSISALQNSDIVVITAGVPRKPGMSRDDLLAINAKVIQNAGALVSQYAPDAFVIVVTNPLDVMVALFQKSSGLPGNRVVGMAGVLDTGRFVHFLAKELDVDPRDINSLVLGGHGDSMVPLPEYTSIAGIPLSHFIDTGSLSQEKLNDICQRTKNGGAEIVEYLMTGSAFVAPACSVIRMIEAYITNSNSILPCCALVQGEYGESGIYFGVPVIINSTGVSKIIELPLSEEKSDMLRSSIRNVKELRKQCSELGFLLD